jgi:hypothetical protein
MKSTLMIKDLALDKQLDGKEMSAVRGGNNTNSGNYNFASAGGFSLGGIGNVNTAVVVAPVTQVDTPTITNIAGLQFAALH